MSTGEYVLITAAAPGSQMTCDCWLLEMFMRETKLYHTMSAPSLADAMAEK